VTQNWWGEALIRTELVRKATKLLSPAKSFRRCRSLAPPSNGPRERGHGFSRSMGNLKLMTVLLITNEIDQTPGAD
jgi:hypothetical protein